MDTQSSTCAGGAAVSSSSSLPSNNASSSGGTSNSCGTSSLGTSSSVSNSGTPSGSSAGDTCRGIGAGRSMRDNNSSISSSIKTSRWGEWSWRLRGPPQQQQGSPSFISRVFRKPTIMRREPDTSKDVRGGRPTFERRRRRYRTVSWKYKKSIGFLASFVFLSNQILAPGLMSMPLTLIEYGWLPSLLVNLLFCLVSTLCSLLLLRSVTLIEGNQNFDERFEYSATLRHFLSPPAADLPPEAALARSTAASTVKATATRASETSGGAGMAPRAAVPGLQRAICKAVQAATDIWKPRRATQCTSAMEDGRPASALPVSMPRGSSTKDETASEERGGEAGRRGGTAVPVVSSLSHFIAGGVATACQALVGMGRFKHSKEGRSASEVAGESSSTSTSDEHGDECRIFHPGSHSTSTRDSDLSRSVGEGEERAAPPLGFHVDAAGGPLPGYLLRRALYSLRILADGQRLPRPQQTLQAQQQQPPDETEHSQQGIEKNSKAAAPPEEQHKKERTWHQQARENVKDRDLDSVAAAVGTESAARATTIAAAESVCEVGTLFSLERKGEVCAAKTKVWEKLKTLTASDATTTSAAAAANSSAVTALPGIGSRQPGAQQPYPRGGIFRRFLTLGRVLLWMQQSVIATLLSPLRILWWLCGLPHRIMQRLYTAMVRPPPLLPSSFPRLLSWLLHLNTFLSTCSAALLVAYCIDCLLLRVFSCSLFIPLLPTLVSSGVGLQPHGSWLAHLAAVGHWIGAIVALFLQPFCVLVSVVASLLDLLAAAAAALGGAVAATTAGAPGNSFTGSASATVARVAEAFAEPILQVGNMLLLQLSRVSVFTDTAAVRLLPDWLPSTLSSVFSSVAGGFVDGFAQEQQIADVYGVPRVPFLYVLSSQQQIEEVFSGVCSSSSSITASCTAAQSSPVEKHPLFSAFLSASSAAGGNSSIAQSSFATTGGAGSVSLASAAAANSVMECLPQCVSHMGISVGYIITAAICLHLAAADLQENARMQFLSFGAIIAAVLQISCSGALMLLYPTPAAVAAPAAQATNSGGTLSSAIPQAAAVVSASLADDGLYAGSVRLPFKATERRTAVRAAECVVGPAAALTARESSRQARCAFALPLPSAGVCKPPTTPATNYFTLPSTSRDGCSTYSYVPMGTGAAVATAATDAAYLQVTADEAPDAGGVAEESSWPSMVVRGSGMGSLVSTFVDAYSYSNALPSWANEVKDNIPVTQTLFMSTTFACMIYFLFGVLCAAAFPTFSASTNVLAAMLPSCRSHVAAACICFFHIFALLPNIVTSQISRRYDLLNMAICLDRQSAFYVASTMPWMLYWLLTFSPVFATPSQLLTLLSNVLLNFAAPALVYVYALHATAPPSLAVVDRGSFRHKVETVVEGGAPAAPHAAIGVPGPEPTVVEPQAPRADSSSPSRECFVGFEENIRLPEWQEREENEETRTALQRYRRQEERMEASEHPGGKQDYLSTNGADMCDVTNSSVVSSTLSACLSRTSSFTYGVSVPATAQVHNQLAALQAQPHFRRFSSTGGVDAAYEGALNSAAGPDNQVEEGQSSHAIPHTAEDSIIGRLRMHAVPEEEGENEDEGHAAETEDDIDDGNCYPSLPLSLSHLRDSHGSVATCSSGGMSRWSTSCFGERHAPVIREEGDLAREELPNTHCFTGLKRTQSQNILSFQSRTLAAGGVGAATGLGKSSLLPGEAQFSLDPANGEGVLARGAEAAMTSVGGIKSSAKGEEKLGKMRVAGAVAGGGGARSREVQRQLQTWLEEYSRLMPESEVAQLLQQQQREEQQERIRLQQQEIQLKKDLRKKVENQWRRQQVFRAEEDRSPSPTCASTGPLLQTTTVLETAVEQNRSSSLPPCVRGGDAATRGGNTARKNAGATPQHGDMDAAGHLKLRRRSSRSLSCGRFLLSHQPNSLGDSSTLTSAAGDDGVGSRTRTDAATGAADVGVSSLAAIVGGGPKEGQMTDTAEQGHGDAALVNGSGASALRDDAQRAEEEEAAAMEASGTGSTGSAAIAVVGKRREEPQQQPSHDDVDSLEESEREGSERTAGQKAEGDATDAASGWDVLSEQDAFSVARPLLSSRGRGSCNSSHLTSDKADSNSRSDVTNVAEGVVQLGVETAAAAITSAAAGAQAINAFTTSVSEPSANTPAAAPAVIVSEVILEGQHGQHQLQQNNELKSEVADVSQAAPLFVRRTTKKCARIDSVSVALQRRQKERLLKREQQQREQQHVLVEAEEQPLSRQLKELGTEQEHQLKEGQTKQLDQQDTEAEVQHRGVGQALLHPDLHAQKPFHRKLTRRPTLVSRTGSAVICKTDASKSCAAALSDTSAAAQHSSGNDAMVAGDKAEPAPVEMQEAGVMESQFASVGAGNGLTSSGVNSWSYASSGGDDLGEKESNICGRTSISRKPTSTQVYSGALITGQKVDACSATVAAESVGWEEEFSCAVFEGARGKHYSIHSTGIAEVQSPTEDVGVQGEQQQRRHGSEGEIVDYGDFQENVMLSHISKRQTEQRDAREASEQAGTEGSVGGSENDSSSSTAGSKISGGRHEWKSEWPRERSASNVSGAGLNGKEVKDKSETGVQSRQTAVGVTGKAAESSGAAVDALPAEFAPHGVKKEFSDVLPYWRIVTFRVKKFRNNVHSRFRRVCCNIGRLWRTGFFRLLCRLPGRGSAEPTSRARQQQNQLVNKSKERVSFFPWLRSTEEQLVATYALLAVVLYSAAAALADEMWSQLEAARLYVWRYTCRLVLLLWPVEWKMVLVPLRPAGTWLEAMHTSLVAATPHIVSHHIYNHVLRFAYTWLSASIKRVQRLAAWLASVDTNVAARPVQYIHKSEGIMRGVHPGLEPGSAGLQHQPGKSVFNESAAAALGEKLALQRLGWESSAAQITLNARAALPPQTTLLYRTEEGEGNVSPSAGLSAETFFIGLLLLVACTLPLLRYASPRKQEAGAARGSRRQRIRS